MNWNIKKTAHYDFYYHSNSLAEKQIGKIISLQESCYVYICDILKVKPNIRIHYYLCKSPHEIGKLYGNNEPTNGLAIRPDKIYAVYNRRIKCIGFHEDVHLISSNTLSRPNQKLLREGLAMYFDKVWWGIPNEAWTQYYLKNNAYPGITKLAQNQEFNKHQDYVTYPIAGVFIDQIITRFGVSKFKTFYKNIKKDFVRCFFDTFGMPIKEFEYKVTDYIINLKYNTCVSNKIKTKLSKYELNHFT